MAGSPRNSLERDPGEKMEDMDVPGRVNDLRKKIKILEKQRENSAERPFLDTQEEELESSKKQLKALMEDKEVEGGSDEVSLEDLKEKEDGEDDSVFNDRLSDEDMKDIT